MRKHHEIKLWPQYEKAVREGRKTFECRVNDRHYCEGDTVRMKIYDPVKEKFLDVTEHPPIDCTVGYVLKIDHERVVWSIIK